MVIVTFREDQRSAGVEAWRPAFDMALPAHNSDEIMGAIQRADYACVLENAMPHALAGKPDAQCTVASCCDLTISSIA